MKVIDILNLSDALGIIAEKELSIGVACKIADAINVLATPLKVINERRNNIIMSYAEKDEDGGVKQEKEGILLSDAKKFEEEMSALLNEEIEVTLPQFKENDFAGVKITAKTAFGLNPILRKEE